MSKYLRGIVDAIPWNHVVKAWRVCGEDSKLLGCGPVFGIGEATLENWEAYLDPSGMKTAPPFYSFSFLFSPSGIEANGTKNERSDRENLTVGQHFASGQRTHAIAIGHPRNKLLSKPIPQFPSELED
ncbi:hypothetical protein CIHG_01502 [Coccidioides immitis H538.4]|uniref:Uncharacterized protein n=3 Tax=Coccidioides immitis TaxID=5501 RepID=A0A0J8TP40_COCIT|nr:hypothetical protein CIRG_01353 [Coccidioides immitis RMSCC 2394]KMU75507.1 hypothetical protein CISG_05141 [Coccidioides immitis RMSCC 3703]KMU83720.1 hypothetical protein CIHG_01502 [Coccidioides immitis H538.4]